MQQRRSLPLIILLLLVLAVAGLFALSYVYVPKADQKEVMQEIDASTLSGKSKGGLQQPVEYP